MRVRVGSLAEPLQHWLLTPYVSMINTFSGELVLTFDGDTGHSGS